MSSSDIALSVRGLSKAYTIAHNAARHTTAAEALMHRLRNPFERPEKETFWALKDVEFDIQKGDVVGIIGRNGAGKSTLLKILSRITEPTAGRIVLHGRVGSLLEVGTGFHPELTGRENIYLNGAILGMSKREIARQFDAIVDFAGVEQFLDTPVKRYSSGMYVRLAFAVAAHLNPEILIIDEVLAVGDAAFQKKCLGKMGEVSREEGKTVLFVSHNMGAIVDLCPRSILLNAGRLVQIGVSSDIIRSYLNDVSQDLADVRLEPGSAEASIVRCWIADETGNAVRKVNVACSFGIGLEIFARQEVAEVEISARVYNALGQPLFTTELSHIRQEYATLAGGQHGFLIPIPGNFLAPDTYTLSVAIHRPNIEVLDNHEHLLQFEVEETGSDMWKYRGLGYGNILARFPWHSNPVVSKPVIPA